MKGEGRKLRSWGLKTQVSCQTPGKICEMGIERNRDMIRIILCHKLVWFGSRMSWKERRWSWQIQCQRASTVGISEFGSGCYSRKIVVVGLV